METKPVETVIEHENKLLEERRKKLASETPGGKAPEDLDSTKFGIALSGGGIRSATINLGFLRTLNLFKILEKADYISTVSGGGYTGAYIQATLKEKGSYKDLFDDVHIEHLRMYGDYLIPGQGKLSKFWNTLMLTVGFVASWAMSILSLLLTMAIIFLGYKMLASGTGEFISTDYLTAVYFDEAINWTWKIFAGLVAIHLISNLFYNFNLNISKAFNQIETALAFVFLLFLIFSSIVYFGYETQEYFKISYPFLWMLGFIVVGFFLNPNSLSFHRYYRKQLADAFLRDAGPYKNMYLKNVFSIEGERRNYLAPYPLINTCLNLQNPGGDNKFKGAKASDYFLLSPAWCGSKLSGYVKTAEFPGFKHLTVPAALTISAAAVNPGMGIYSNKMLSIFMTLFNARLGFWVNNPSFDPKRKLPDWLRYVVWWPSYFFKELMGAIGTDSRKLNISDGGHIENLAVYGLLRRKCRLILAVDAGADPASSFADLENLYIRARNELGIDIAFRQGNDPVDLIRPKASSGYAQKRFAIADLLKIWEEFCVTDENGQNVLFCDGKVVAEKGETLEALVNYFYSKENNAVLKFRVDLKAQRGVDLPNEDYDRLRKMVEKQVKAQLDAMTDKQGVEKMKVGTLVYIKSSVTAPRKFFVPKTGPKGEKNYMFDTFKYKIYHPEFPHESTADQFFDPVQWESYYQLGQFIGVDVLDMPRAPSEYVCGEQDVSIQQLQGLFDKGVSLFRKEDRLVGLVDASAVSAEIADNADLEVLEPERSSAMPPPENMGYGAPPAPEPAPTSRDAIAEEMQFKI